MDMFSSQGHCLFKPNDLIEHFAGWEVLMSKNEIFPAPGNTQKVFATAIARKPQEWSH